ncbi:MAG: STAS domain-containing protein [Vulcanimicrobiaceae bacterium]
MAKSFCVVDRGNMGSVVVEGDVDLTNFAELEAMIQSAATQAQGVVVDLASCTYLDSSGLGVLIRRFNVHGDRMRIVLPRNGGARRVFEITGLTGALPAYESFDEAVRNGGAAASSQT